mgnify:CR=1 FL=1
MWIPIAGCVWLLVAVALIRVCMKQKGKETKYFEAQVLPHGDIEKFFPNIWQVTGSLPRMGLPRNMLIYKKPDGELVLHSVIALHKENMEELEQIGNVSSLIVPNSMHTFDIAAYQIKYVYAKVVSISLMFKHAQRGQTNQICSVCSSFLQR